MGLMGADFGAISLPGSLSGNFNHLLHFTRIRLVRLRRLRTLWYRVAGNIAMIELHPRALGSPGWEIPELFGFLILSWG